ncbi:hypothetical protein LCGC14_2343280 [marine sediment metagenome]|uniref:Uncharacterized protein n=1 Tax=marine sediment metagenome TaxID=412755 RepID=A0A0F9EP08_9ZZZZ
MNKPSVVEYIIELLDEAQSEGNISDDEYEKVSDWLDVARQCHGDGPDLDDDYNSNEEMTG